MRELEAERQREKGRREHESQRPFKMNVLAPFHSPSMAQTECVYAM